MKKLALAVAGVMLAGSLFAFAGCDNGGNTGVVKGNYKEMTAAEATEAVKDIELENAFGDPSQEGFKIGFEAKADLSMNVSFSMTMSGQTSEMNMDGSVKAGYKVVVEPKGEDISVAGAGDFSLKANSSTATGDEKTSNKAEMSANIYQDSEYMYLDAQMTSGENTNEEKMKIAFEDVLEGIMDIIGDSFALVDETETELPEGSISGGVNVSMNLGTAISALAEAGFTVSLDQSSGTKIKISADKELIIAAIKEAGDNIPFDLDSLDFSSAELALYLSFDKDGKFVQAGFNVNVAAKLDAMNNGSGMKADVSVKGGVELKLFTGTVTLPEGIDAYPLQSL